MKRPIHPVATRNSRDLLLEHPELRAIAERQADTALVLATTVGAPIEQYGKFLGFVVVFAAGLYAGALLFGGHHHTQPTVVYCPTPGSAQVALLPAECGPQDGAR